jgi:hypothetical protein
VRFSETVRSVYRLNRCDMYPTSGFIRRGCRVISVPSMSARPDVGTSSPHKTRIRVDLPEPFGPSSPKMLPGSIESDTRSSAVNRPNRIVTPSIEMGNAIAAS